MKLTERNNQVGIDTDKKKKKQNRKKGKKETDVETDNGKSL